MSRHDRPYAAIRTCGQTGKRGYRARGDARKALRDLHPGQRQGMRAYHCEHCDLWHLGHLPWAVKRGQATARDHYDKYDGGDPK